MRSDRRDVPGVHPHIGAKGRLAGPVVDAGVLDEHVGRVQRIAEQTEADEGEQNTWSHVVASCDRCGILQAACAASQYRQRRRAHRWALRAWSSWTRAFDSLNVESPEAGSARE